MTPDERQLISGLFDRMRAFQLPEKDREAEALINQAVRAMPDAPYMLVQSVLVQEQALEAASNRVQELEERLRALQEGGERPRQSGGSFLGGLFGGASPTAAQRPSSVPVIGSRAGALPSRPPGGPEPVPPQAQPASGGFMRSAMATAAGVAGGMLLAEGVRNMMGGGSAHANTTAADSEKQKAADKDDNDKDDDHDHDDGHDDGGGDWGDGGIDV